MAAFLKTRLAGFIIIVLLAVYSGATQGIIPTIIKLSPFAQELLDLLPKNSPDVKQDSLRLGEYFKAIARLLREDRKRADGRLVQQADAQDFMKRAGDIVIGDGWKLPEKYPQLTKRLVTELEKSTEATLPDDLERLGSALSEIGGATNEVR